MNWISRLERRFGRFAIPNLMYVIIIFVCGRLFAEHSQSLFLYPVFVIECFGDSAWTDLEDCYLFDPAAVGQCDIFADCTLLLLYDRERTGADVGIVPL